MGKTPVFTGVLAMWSRPQNPKEWQFRKPLLYPLSYEGGDGAKCGAKFAATPHVIFGKASGA